MRIAYFTETFIPHVDGIVFTLIHLLDYLAEKGHESIMFTPRGQMDKFAQTKIYRQTSFKMPLYKDRFVATPLARVEKNTLTFRPDLIHVVAPTSLGIAGLRVARKHNIPLVASYQTDLAGFARHWKLGVFAGTINRFYRTLHNRADVNLAPSEFTRKQLEKIGIKRLTVWPGGASLEQFSPAKRGDKWRSRLMGGDSDKLLILFVSRLSREKRAELLLPLVRDVPGVRLAIVGDGPDRSRLEKVFAGTDTYFAGYQTGENLAECYAAGDIFVFTGAEETFGNVVVEAMASGTPVIAPNSGGVVDLVADGETGYLYKPGDAKDLMAAFKKLAGDRELAKRMGQAGYERAQQFTWQNSFEILLGVYEKLLAEKAQTTN